MFLPNLNSHHVLYHFHDFTNANYQPCHAELITAIQKKQWDENSKKKQPGSRLVLHCSHRSDRCPQLSFQGAPTTLELQPQSMAWSGWAPGPAGYWVCDSGKAVPPQPLEQQNTHTLHSSSGQTPQTTTGSKKRHFAFSQEKCKTFPLPPLHLGHSPWAPLSSFLTQQLPFWLSPRLPPW